MTPKYFDSIDGLRALAVAAVLFYHAGFDFAEGGFIGVDVFFVISGFLITGIIRRDIVAGKWSFGKFYLRRAVRLTPALFVTIIATLAAGFFILSPEDLESAGQSGLFAAISASNFLFWLEAGYFDQAAASKPLLHTWSLGVEEQFYLLWPAIVFILLKWKGINVAIAGLAILGVASLLFAFGLEGTFPQAVFFLMPFRIHQFALGGLLALTAAVKPGPKRDLAGLCAATAIIANCYFASGEEAGYWLNAFLPAIAAAAFIWAAEGKFVKAVFASAPMVWIGRRSYSIYLVHWPLIVLWPLATDFELSPTEGVIAIALSVLSGALLHDAVEKPLRFKKSTTPVQRRRSIVIAMSLLFVSVAGGTILWSLEGVPGRLPVEIREAMKEIRRGQLERVSQVRSGVCNLAQHTPISQYQIEECATPPPDKRSYMVIGDSYGAGAYYFLKEAYPEIYFGQMTLPGCFLKRPWNKQKVQKRTDCEQYYTLAFQYASSNGFDGVVFAASWKAWHREELDELIKWAKNNNLDPVVTSYRPFFKRKISDFLQTSGNFEQAEIRAQDSLLKFHEAQAQKMNERLSGKAKIIDLYSLMCPEVCKITDDNGNLIYFDNSHLTPYGIAWLAKRIRKEYPDLFAESTRQ